MRVLLIDPLCKNPKFESPNVKLAYAAAVLEKLEISVDIFDFIVSEFDEIKMKDYLIKRDDFFNLIETCEEDYDYIYLNCEYGILSSCIQIARKIKKATVIVGGTYINYLYNGGIISKTNYKYLNSINYVSIGDIETDIAYIVGKKIAKTENVNIINSGMVKLLDQIPSPAWYKYDISKYDGKLYIIGAKGCNYNKCTFCDEKLIWGNAFRYRTPIKVAEEIKKNKEEYNISDYFFWDASIAAYPHLEELCSLLSLPEYKCSWTALARVMEINEKRLEMLKKAGCQTIEIGIESLQDNTLYEMNKGTNYDEIKKKIQMIKNFDISIEGSFLIGYPSESTEQIQDTIKKSLDLEIDFYRWHNFQLYSSYIKKYPELINARDWFETDINYPNHLLLQVISNHPVAFLEMHMASRVMSFAKDVIPDIRLGKTTLREIYALTYWAINETEKGIIGHNPYI